MESSQVVPGQALPVSSGPSGMSNEQMMALLQQQQMQMQHMAQMQQMQQKPSPAYANAPAPKVDPTPARKAALTYLIASLVVTLWFWTVTDTYNGME
ncbi:hypothetical protein KIPB_008847 [Kipferlia bialata]|uniref:Uncharacterized protein n=1 Tax=Kipferlia bialata TaxID=797122 RepID=A0A391NNS3_9EUKA|nr:hypothetical protein KIPB_008847 [Kipferlia bialata]|eukprot:g8847.t1